MRSEVEARYEDCFDLNQALALAFKASSRQRSSSRFLRFQAMLFLNIRLNLRRPDLSAPYTRQPPL